MFLHVKSKMDVGHTTTNRGGERGECLLLRLVAKMDEETMALIPKRRRDMQQPNREAKEETVHSYVLRSRWRWRPQRQHQGGRHNNQPGGKVNCSISCSIVINDAPRN